jgi:hypothetical protein
MVRYGSCYMAVPSAKPLLDRVPLHSIGQPTQLLLTYNQVFIMSYMLCYTVDIGDASLALDASNGTGTAAAKHPQTCGSRHVALNELQHVWKRVSLCNVGNLHHSAQLDLGVTICWVAEFERLGCVSRGHLCRILARKTFNVRKT